MEYDTRGVGRCSRARVKKDTGGIRGILDDVDTIVGVGAELRNRASGGGLGRGRGTEDFRGVVWGVP